MPCVTCVPDTDGRIGDDACVICACTPVATCDVCDVCDEPCNDDGSCDTCVICDRCGDREVEDDTVLTLRGSTICDFCRRNYYWQCEHCDGWNRDGNGCADGCCADECHCSDCSGSDFGGLVYDAGYRPEPVFRGTGPLYLGPEIEIEAGYDGAECARTARSFLGGLGYLKADGSLMDGFEIVTHPMSYEWAMANFPWQMLTRLRQLGCETPCNTGIHVHVSRAAFASPCHTYRWMKFIYRNESQVTTLARRSCPGYAAFTADDRRAVKHYAKGGSGDRYRAINTQNTDTFELRIFASSLNPREVQAALGFAAASVEYTRDLTVRQITDGGWTWAAFVDWLAERPTYAPLSQELEALACVC
ncbi:MAG TPA: hypothetical protein VK453_12130 [Micromonosporaceae bacterium]|nr:hypothetical protein [Micromonosporaceae bacterium]